MRILLCLHASPIERAAGVEVYSDALARALSQTNEVALLYPGRRDRSVGDSHRGDVVRHFIVRRSGSPRSFVETYQDVRAHREIEQVFDLFRPEVVHVQHLSGLSSRLPALAQERGIPVVMTLHDYWLQCAAGGQRFHRSLGRCDEVSLERCASCTAHMSAHALRANAQLARIGLRVRAPFGPATDEADSGKPSPQVIQRALSTVRRVAAGLSRVETSVQRSRIQARWDALLAMADDVDRFVVPSAFMREEMLRFGLPEFAMTKLDLGIASLHAGNPRRLPDSARHFAYLGGIARHKGVHTLIEAVNSFPADVRVTIWGDESDDPAYAAQLRARAAHPGITFGGKLSQLEVAKHLREVDALVVPSLWYENSPLVIREAFSAGIPVVATKLAGHRELLESGGGILYDPDVPGELARCLARLMHEHGLARRLVETQPRVKTIEEHAIEIDALYREIVNEIDDEISAEIDRE